MGRLLPEESRRATLSKIEVASENAHDPDGTRKLI